MNSNSNPIINLSTQSNSTILEASSVGRIAYSRLKEGAEGSVQEVFDNAINILYPEGLVSIVPEAIQRGPLNVTLLLPIGLSKLSFLGVRAGDKVKVQGFTLDLGDHHLVSFGSAEIYSPKQKFTLPILASNEIEANIKVMRKTALLFGNMAGLGGLLSLAPPRVPGATSESLNLFASYAFNRIVKLEEAFRKEEKNALRDAVTDLIGLGPGLTPSSDDMLAGLVLLCVLYAKNRGCSLHASQLIARLTVEESRGRTTMLSEEYLGQVASGRGNEPIMKLCTALLTEGRESVERETRRVLAIGETSGTDMVLGIVLGTSLCTGRKLNLIQKEYE